MNYQNQPAINYGAKGVECAVERPPSPLSQRFAELEALAKQFQSIAHGFDDKLNTVLSPQMLGGQDNKAQVMPPRPVVAPLVERLDSVLNEFRAIAARLNDIQDRIAL